MPIPLSPRHKWYTAAVLYSSLYTHSQLTSQRENVQQHSQWEAGGNSNRTVAAHPARLFVGLPDETYLDFKYPAEDRPAVKTGISRLFFIIIIIFELHFCCAFLCWIRSYNIITVQVHLSTVMHWSFLTAACQHISSLTCMFTIKNKTGCVHNFSRRRKTSLRQYE